MIPLEEMSDEQFGLHVLGLLKKKLGPRGMSRLLSTFWKGNIDYTRDRHFWLDGISMEEILKEAGYKPTQELLEKEAS